jgi:hypothetical protein
MQKPLTKINNVMNSNMELCAKHYGTWRRGSLTVLWKVSLEWQCLRHLKYHSLSGEVGFQQGKTKLRAQLHQPVTELPKA